MFETLSFRLRGKNPSDHKEMVEEGEETIYYEEHRIRHLDLKNEVELSMVFIRESIDFPKDDLAVFPPINHENLYIDGYDRDRESPSESSSPLSSSRLSDSSSSSSLSPSDSDGRFEFDRRSRCRPSETDGKSPASPSHLRVQSPLSRWKSLCYSMLEIDITQCWWKLLLARVLSKFQNLVTCFSRNSLHSFYPILGIVIWWWIRNRARRRLHEGEIAAHLRDTIKEKDECSLQRIAQLLHQIAQMNEFLVKKKHFN